MKVIQINSYGGPEVLKVNNNAVMPVSKVNQVLVEVHAASINPIDWKIREGYLKQYAPLQFPVTLGGDFSGIVKQAAGDFEMGEEVYGTSNVLTGGSGSFAELTAANISNIAKKPQSENFIDASAMPLVGVSALQAIEEYINLKKGQKILIHGGAGGIGSTAIQLAKSIGAYVVTTVSGHDMEYVKKLGADEIIDYKKEKFEDKLKELDGVFDTVGGETTNKSFRVIKKGGVLVSMLGQPDDKMANEYRVTAIGENAKTDTDHLKRLTELINEGSVKPQVDKIFSLEQAKEAFKTAEEGVMGKVVFKVKA